MWSRLLSLTAPGALVAAIGLPNPMLEMRKNLELSPPFMISLATVAAVFAEVVRALVTDPAF